MDGTAVGDFGEHLNHLVRQRGWTMAEFAQRVGSTPSTLSRIRNGKRVPRSADLERWCTVLALDAQAAQRLRESALLAQAPEALRQRLAQAEAAGPAGAGRAETAVAPRSAQTFYDGLWLAYHCSFLNDQTITRSLAHVAGGEVAWLNMESGEVHYSYTGAARVLGDKIFVLMEEDRGGAEFVQVTLDALFHLRCPTVLYGIVTGVSGKTVRHPYSAPAAARIVMIHAAGPHELTRDPDRLPRIQALLGSFETVAIRPLVPAFLDKEALLRRCLELRPREDLDAVLLRMIDNRLEPGEQTLSAGFR